MKPPKYTHGYIDQHDKPRFYLRRPGFKKIPLPGLPWSPEFMEAREAALKGGGSAIEIGASRTVAGTVNAALISYYGATVFAVLAKSTRGSRRAILETFRNDHGDKRIALIHSTAIQNILNKKTPTAARNWKKALRGFVDHCLSLGMIKVDPLVGLKLAKTGKSTGFHTWAEDEIAQYQARHAPGTKARLALMLLLQTGHARADVVRMGRQHIKAGKISMRRQKTKVQFDIPVLPDLLAEMALHPKGEQLAFLTTEAGKPFSAAGFGNKFRTWCDEAGLPHCAAHGLRKASAVRHALNGATVFELMAWHAWKTITEAQRYVEEANRIRLSESAGAKVISGTAIGSPMTPVSQNDDQAIEITRSGK